LELQCIVRFKNPCHIGYGTGGQVRDFRNKPYIPSIILSTQIYLEALRFAIPLKRQISPPKVSDGITCEEPNIVKIRGKEFFRNDIYFLLNVEDMDLDIYLAALKSLQNTGIGASTSQGFGYNQIIIVNSNGIPQKLNDKFSEFFKEEKFYNPSLVRLVQSIFSRIKRNWSSWKRAYSNIGPFINRVYYKINITEKVTSSSFRGELRRKLIEITGTKHKDEVAVCGPRDIPCKVCKLMGYMGGKSRVIVRSFSGRQGNSIYVIGENLTLEEKELLEEAFGEGNYQKVLEETLSDYVP